MTEQEINNLHDSLITTAQTIETSVNLLLVRQNAAEDAKSAKDAIGAGILKQIASNRILYRNDDERKSAYVEEITLSKTYENARNNERAALAEKFQTEGLIEANRKKFRAAELLLLYYANH